MAYNAYGQIPDVVNLNVGGVPYTTLLSTLTKEEDSTLAAMFTGRIPIYKDKDGQYFIDADGGIFKNILEYLKTDIPPSFDNPPFGGGGGGGGGFGGGGFAGGGFGGGGLFGSPSRASYSDQQVILMHREASLLGLKKLVRHIEQHRAVFVEKLLADYRTSKQGYGECLSKIFAELTLGTLFENNSVIFQLCQDTQVNTESRCCNHKCVGGIQQNGFTDVFSFDDLYHVVPIPFEIDLTFLNCLCIDLRRLGFNVRGRVSECQFACKKAQRSQSVFSFGGQRYPCCKKVMYLIQFANTVQETYVDIYRPHLQGSVSINQFQNTSLFGASKGFGAGSGQGKPFGGSTFESSQNETHPSSGFSFGSNQNQSHPSTGVGFASNQNQGQLSSGFSFGTNQNQSQPSTGFGFASNQNQGQLSSGFSFGTNQNQDRPSGVSGAVFGANLNQTQTFGSAPAFGTLKQTPQFGNSASFGSNTKQSQTFKWSSGSESNQNQTVTGANKNEIHQASGVFGSAKSQPSVVGIPKNVFGASTGKFGFGKEQAENNPIRFGGFGGFGTQSNTQQTTNSGTIDGVNSGVSAGGVVLNSTSEHTSLDSATANKENVEKQPLPGLSSGSALQNALSGLQLTADAVATEETSAGAEHLTFGNATTIEQIGFGLKCQRFDK